MAKRPRGFIESYNPRTKAYLLEQVKEVLEEYHAQLPLTCRQIFYRLVGRFQYEKTEAAYRRLAEMLVLARRGRVIPFDSIRDDGVVTIVPDLWQSAHQWSDAMARSAETFRLSPWLRQPLYVEVICEAGGMAPMLARVADPYGVTVRSGGGFDSLTAKHDLAQHYARQGKHVIVLHVGDFDPSGEALWQNLRDDVGAFCSAMGGTVYFERVAVTLDQQELYDLPTSPPKASDRRGEAFPDDVDTVQAEALPPDLLQEIVRIRIETCIDLDALGATRTEEREIRQQLIERLA
ncbi:MAG: hypothetical protein ACOVNL_00715 [Prochlorococcaceae cyanobacterium]|jgi:hypothetical protein